MAPEFTAHPAVMLQQFKRKFPFAIWASTCIYALHPLLALPHNRFSVLQRVRVHFAAHGLLFCYFYAQGPHLFPTLFFLLRLRQLSAHPAQFQKCHHKVISKKIDAKEEKRDVHQDDENHNSKAKSLAEPARLLQFKK